MHSGVSGCRIFKNFDFLVDMGSFNIWTSKRTKKEEFFHFQKCLDILFRKLENSFSFVRLDVEWSHINHKIEIFEKSYVRLPPIISPLCNGVANIEIGDFRGKIDIGEKNYCRGSNHCDVVYKDFPRIFCCCWLSVRNDGWQEKLSGLHFIASI
jgi:hypothetical protein